MSDEAGLRHKLTKKLKFAVGRAKTSTRANDGTKKWKNSKHETDMAVSDHDERKRSFKSSSKPPRSGKERVDGEGFRHESSGLKRKRVFADRGIGEEGNVGKSQSGERRNDRNDSVRGRERRVDRDESYRGKERVNDRGDEAFKGRERRSDKDRGFRGKVSVRDRDESYRGKERMNDRVNNGDDSNRGRERRNDRHELFRGKERMNEGGDSFRGMERRGNREDESFRGRERVNDRDDSFRGRDRRNDRDDSFRGTDRRFDRNDSFRGKEKRYGRDDSYRGREKRNDREGSVTGNMFGKGRDAQGSEFGEEKGRRNESQPSRAGRENVVSRFGDKRSSRGVEGNARGVEVSNGSADRTSNRRVLDGKNSKNKTDPTELEDQKQSDKREAGTLEGAAKKLLRHRKSLIETAELRDGLRKKKKRGHRLDPNDISNKRIDDGISIDGSPVEKKVDQADDDEMSMNAQFRAIQPSPSILSFVEDNLLGRRRLIEFRRSGYNIDLSAPLDNVPFTTSSERERVEEPVFRNKLEFFAAAKVSSSFPPPELPEIAFAGRSNVGKSSLLNALTRQWGVVRVSDKPGLTQTINFFKLGPKLSLVDLPGYGFAYAKEEVKDAWEELVKEYVSTRVGLRRVCLLIDTKWGMKPRDHELINLMERSQTNYQIVLTKTDAVFPIDVARRAMQIEGNLKASACLVDPVMMVSSKTGGGIRSLRAVLSKISRFAKL